MKINLTPEIVRIHAHLCGDGALYTFKTKLKDRNNVAEIVYYNTNLKLINSFRKDMNKEFGVQMTYRPKQNLIRIRSIRIAKVLLSLSEYGTRQWRIPNEIKSATKKLKIEWIKAFSHDDGYVPSDRNYIRIKSMNEIGLKDIQEMLFSIDINSTLTGPNCDKSYYLNIKKENGLEYFTKEKCRK